VNGIGGVQLEARCIGNRNLTTLIEGIYVKSIGQSLLCAHGSWTRSSF
jgi:hypothetical protein